MKRLSSLDLLGTLALASLTACSSDGGDVTDFCALSNALDDVAEGVALMRSFATSASKATEVAALMTEAEALGTEMHAVDAKMTAAADLLEAAAIEYCE